NTPHLASILRLRHEMGDFPLSQVEFASHSHPYSGWKEWTNYILKKYKLELDCVGIADSVTLRRDLEIFRDKESLNVLVSHCCFETHTFMAPWGFFTVTLEGVMELYRLPLIGEIGPSNIDLLPHEKDEEVDKDNCFYVGEGFGTKLEVAAFLSMWLLGYLLLGNPSSEVSRQLFPLALKLASGHSFSLASVILGTLYEHLN
ncbi:PMD domain-containing protein, partial [Cephalotus follicularis]